MPRLSVVIITLNEERNILRTIGSVKGVADELVVVDSMSSDRTPELCEQAGCRVIRRPFDGYGTQKQFAVDQAAHDWVLSLDADEVLTETLQKEIRALLSTEPPFEGYLVPRSLVFMGRRMKHGGTGREMLLRLFDRTKGGFTNTPVHEEIRVDGPCGTLKGELLHYSYRDISHHLEKLNTYTSLAAEDYARKGKSFSKCWPALKFPVSFFTFYVLKGGFRDGYPGFMWSFLAAVYGLLKVAKTIEKKDGNTNP